MIFGPKHVIMDETTFDSLPMFLSVPIKGNVWKIHTRETPRWFLIWCDTSWRVHTRMILIEE
jgi:hypothetical protein